MLQIIGWLGCVYLIIKGLEIASNIGNRTENGELRGTASAAIIISYLFAFIFAVWLYAQGGAMGSSASNMSSVNAGIDISKYGSGPSAYLACNNDAKNLDEKVECGKLIGTSGN